MLQFLVKRLIGLIFVIICVTFITFILGYFSPGDPIRNLLGQHFDKVLYLQLRHEYGLDLPWYEQYYRFLVALAHFDFGLSFYFQSRPVWDILKDGTPISLELSAWGLVVTILVGIPLGLISAIRANTWLDSSSMGMALIFYSIPTFVLAVFFQVAVILIDKSAGLQWPVANWGTPWHYTWNDIQYKLGPILVFSAGAFAAFARLARTSMLEVLRQDYVRTARAKGMREQVVLYRHALRNALIPLVTYVGYSIGLLVTAVFFVEQVFNLPGIGTTAIIAISNRDYPVIQATTILGAVAVVLGNLLSDLLYSVADPRIKSE